MKNKHDVIGMLNEEGSDIVAHVHQRHKVGECPWCDFIRVENISKEFLYRLDHCEKEIHGLYMWSLGTSLSDTKYNRKLLLKRWHLFSKAMYRIEDWKPVFRIIEKGRRGFLHIHVVCISFCDHRVVLNKWRDQTMEKSNVHVSGYKGDKNPRRLARYLMKYLSKEGSAYRWLGSFYGLGRNRLRNVTNRPNAQVLRYGGVMYYTFDTEAYRENECQKLFDV